MLNQKINTIQEQIKRILFISNYNLNNPPKLINENYYNEKEIDYNDVEKENEKGYPSSIAYQDEYQVDEQAPGEKKKPKEPAPELAPKPEAGLPSLPSPEETPPEPAGKAPGEEIPPVDKAPPPTPEAPPKEEKPEVPSASKTDVKSVEKDVESVEDYSKKVMTQQSEILTKVDDLVNKLSNVDNLSQKVDQLSQNIEKIKSPSYKDQLEMISVNSKPFDVKLSDYWSDLGGEEQPKQEPQEYKLDKEDIINYDTNEIKQSLFTTGEEDEESLRNQRSMGY